MSRPDETVQFTAKERGYVFGVAMKYMKDEERANDVAQDAMMLAYRYRDSFRGESRYTTWLYRIATTTALMHLRKDRRRAQHVTDIDDADDAIEAVDPRSSPEEVTGAAEAMRLATGHLTDMGEKYGEIFALRYVDGYSESEIARRLKLHVATVKTRAYRARLYVRDQLAVQLAA